MDCSGIMGESCDSKTTRNRTSRLVGYFPLYRVFVHKSSVRVSLDYASSSLDNCPRDTSTRGGGGDYCFMI